MLGAQPLRRRITRYSAIMLPTVREVMALDAVRVGAPRLVAGESGLDRPVRWVHSAEVPDIASLLRGGRDPDPTSHPGAGTA